jgi:hypothetical protein
MNYPITNKAILALVKPDQKVFFVGSYNVADRNIQNNGITSTLPMNISVNSNGYNLRVVQSFKINDLNIPEVNFLDENYSVTSYDTLSFVVPNKIIGQINFCGLYENNSKDTITNNSIQIFNVNSSSGIYSNITNVIIDFSNPIRIAYFIGNNKCF